MTITELFFTKLNEKTIEIHLSFSDGNDHGTIRAQGVSRKQCVYNLCKEKKLSWELFSEASRLASNKLDPRFCKVTRYRNQALEAREEKLADICDDMGCSVAEAVAFLDKDIMPSGW